MTRKQALEKYYQNPTYCLFCKQLIRVRDNENPTDVRRRTFCNKSCSAKYNNTGRRYGKAHFCNQCNKLLPSSQRKYCNNTCRDQYRFEKRLNEIKQQGYFTGKSTTMRKYFKKIKPYICEICDQIPKWKGKPLTLTLDHINGHSEDNRIENLRWVCPNCDTQLPTYGAKNWGNGRKSRRKINSKLNNLVKVPESGPKERTANP